MVFYSKKKNKVHFLFVTLLSGEKFLLFVYKFYKRRHTCRRLSFVYITYVLHDENKNHKMTWKMVHTLVECVMSWYSQLSRNWSWSSLSFAYCIHRCHKLKKDFLLFSSFSLALVLCSHKLWLRTLQKAKNNKQKEKHYRWMKFFLFSC